MCPVWELEILSSSAKENICICNHVQRQEQKQHKLYSLYIKHWILSNVLTSSQSIIIESIVCSNHEKKRNSSGNKSRLLEKILLKHVTSVQVKEIMIIGLPPGFIRKCNFLYILEKKKIILISPNKHHHTPTLLTLFWAPWMEFSWNAGNMSTYLSISSHSVTIQGLYSQGHLLCCSLHPKWTSTYGWLKSSLGCTDCISKES